VPYIEATLPSLCHDNQYVLLLLLGLLLLLLLRYSTTCSKLRKLWICR